MSERTTQILEAALSLPAQERAKLAEQILSSLELTPHQKIDQLWALEVEDRLDAFHKGELKTIPAREVFDKV